jgi:hypothetical protein
MDGLARGAIFAGGIGLANPIDKNADGNGHCRFGKIAASHCSLQQGEGKFLQDRRGQVAELSFAPRAGASKLVFEHFIETAVDFIPESNDAAHALVAVIDCSAHRTLELSADFGNISSLCRFAQHGVSCEVALPPRIFSMAVTKEIPAMQKQNARILPDFL